MPGIQEKRCVIPTKPLYPESALFTTHIPTCFNYLRRFSFLKPAFNFETWYMMFVQRLNRCLPKPSCNIRRNEKWKHFKTPYPSSKRKFNLSLILANTFETFPASGRITTAHYGLAFILIIFLVVIFRCIKPGCRSTVTIGSLNAPLSFSSFL